MFGEDQRWATTAGALGLVLLDPAPPGIGFHSGASFSHLKRAMGGPARPPFSSGHWMYGTRQVGSTRGRPPRAIEVLVLVNVVSAGSSSTTYTHTIARIDPPLLLGLALRPTSWIERKLSAAPYPFNDPRLDEKIRLDVRQSQAPRALTLLTSRGGPAPGLATRLASVQNASFLVADGSVDIHSSSGVVTDVDTIARRLDFAAVLAAEIVEQNAWLPADPIASALEGLLRAFGDAHRFTLDAPRMRLDGEVAGARVRISLESEREAIFTAVTVDLPRNLGLGLRMKPQGSMQFLASFFGSQDIEVGDPVFDDRFVIQGTVQAYVQSALADPALRRAIWELAHGAADVRIDDARLFFRYPRAPTTEHQLSGIVDRIGIAMQGLFPSGPAPGPYR